MCSEALTKIVKYDTFKITKETLYPFLSCFYTLDTFLSLLQSLIILILLNPNLFIAWFLLYFFFNLQSLITPILLNTRLFIPSSSTFIYFNPFVNLNPAYLFESLFSHPDIFSSLFYFFFLLQNQETRPVFFYLTIHIPCNEDEGQRGSEVVEQQRRYDKI